MNDDTVGFLAFIGLILCLGVGLILWSKHDIDKRKPELDKQLELLKCQHTGYKGKSEEKVYMCATGVFFVRNNQLKRAE